jgi:hypothetical protein
VNLVQSGAVMGMVGGTLSDLTMHPNKVNRQINMLSFVSFIYAEQRKYYHLSLNIKLTICLIKSFDKRKMKPVRKKNC